MKPTLILLQLACVIGCFSGFARVAAEGPKVGDAAPDFALAGTDGKTHKLSDFKGKQAVVLAWYPKASTPGCTAECKSLQEHRGVLEGLEAAVFGASVDGPEANRKFAESLGLGFPLLSDPTGVTAKAYGVYNQDRKIAQRMTFYIGKDGRILHIDRDVKTGSHGADVVAKLKELGVEAKR